MDNDLPVFDKRNFELVFRNHFVSLCQFALKYVHDLDTAKEIVHDCFINLWEKRETIDTSKPVKSYLSTSVYNRCLNYIRDNKKMDRDESHFQNLDNGASDHGDKLMEKELEEKIERVIESLPDACKTVFKMNRFDGLKYSEIAGKLNISVKTVESHMSKALKVLRENLSDYLTIIIAIFFLNG
ncbi:MAG: RNA polymerase sigma-70 factor [Bacteroidota bacterium]